MLLTILRRYLKPHWRLLVGVGLFQAAQSIASLFLPNLVADIIDNGVAKGDVGHILMVGSIMLVITLVAILLVACVLVMLIVSGPLADSIGSVAGLGSQAVTGWNIAKWPVIVIFVVLIVAMLYYATPNVKQPRFRWISVGAFVAIIVWIVASVLFAFYVGTFGSYDKTYGSLAGAVAGLLWLWITNVALLFGAELDSEMERGRELQAGIAAERELQLPPRDTRGIRKARKKEAKDVARGRAIREQAVGDQAADSPPDDDTDGRDRNESEKKETTR